MPYYSTPPASCILPAYHWLQLKFRVNCYYLPNKGEHATRHCIRSYGYAPSGERTGSAFSRYSAAHPERPEIPIFIAPPAAFRTRCSTVLLVERESQVAHRPSVSALLSSPAIPLILLTPGPASQGQQADRRGVVWVGCTGRVLCGTLP
jgi:hypothetical protein